MYYHIVMPLLRETDKVNCLRRRDVLKKVEAIFTLLTSFVYSIKYLLSSSSWQDKRKP